MLDDGIENLIQGGSDDSSRSWGIHVRVNGQCQIHVFQIHSCKLLQTVQVHESAILKKNNVTIKFYVKILVEISQQTEISIQISLKLSFANINTCIKGPALIISEKVSESF